MPKSINALIPLALALTFPALADECKLERANTLHARFTPTDRLVVDVSMNGRTSAFALAPDIAFTGLTPSAATRNGSAEFDLTGASIFYHGERIDVQTRVADLDFANFTNRDTFLPVLPDDADPQDGSLDGLIGADMLKQYDIEFDPGTNQTILFNASHCARAPVYWAKEWFELPLSNERGHAMETAISLNGKPVTAVVDLSAGHSSLPLAFARRDFGIGETGSHKFDTMALGSITFRNVSFDVVEPVPRGAAAAMPRLGMHELKRFRFYLSNANSKLYFTIPSEAQASLVSR